MTQALLLLTMLGMAGYTSIGPRTVTRDRFDYTGAGAESGNGMWNLFCHAAVHMAMPTGILDLLWHH
jgi:hypothetical protein